MNQLWDPFYLCWSVFTVCLRTWAKRRKLHWPKLLATFKCRFLFDHNAKLNHHHYWADGFQLCISANVCQSFCSPLRLFLNTVVPALICTSKQEASESKHFVPASASICRLCYGDEYGVNVLLIFFMALCALICINHGDCLWDVTQGFLKGCFETCWWCPRNPD